MHSKPMMRSAFTPVITDTPRDPVDDLQRIEEALYEDIDELTQAMDFIALYEIRKQELGHGSILNVHKKGSAKSKSAVQASHTDRKKIRGKCQRLPPQKDKQYPVNPEVGYREPIQPSSMATNHFDYGQSMFPSQSTNQLTHYTEGLKGSEMKPCISVSNFISCNRDDDELPAISTSKFNLPVESQLHQQQGFLGWKQFQESSNLRQPASQSQQMFGMSLPFQSSHKLGQNQPCFNPQMTASSRINAVIPDPVKPPIPTFGHSNRMVNQCSDQIRRFDKVRRQTNEDWSRPFEAIPPVYQAPSRGLSSFDYNISNQHMNKSMNFYTQHEQVPRFNRRLHYKEDQDQQDYRSLYESPSRPFKTPPSRQLISPAKSPQRVSNKKERQEKIEIRPMRQQRKIQPTSITIQNEYEVKSSKFPIFREENRRENKPDYVQHRRYNNPDNDDTIQRHSSRREELMYQQQQPDDEARSESPPKISQVSEPRIQKPITHSPPADPPLVEAPSESNIVNKFKYTPKPPQNASSPVNPYKPTPKPTTPKQQSKPSSLKPSLITPNDKKLLNKSEKVEKLDKSVDRDSNSNRNTYSRPSKPASQETREYFNKNFKVKVDNIILSNTVSKISIDLSEQPMEVAEDAMYQSPGEEFDIGLEKSLEQLEHTTQKRIIQGDDDLSFDYRHSKSSYA